MVLLVLCALMLLIFTCTHYGNWWSLFILLATGVAILVPNICWGYDTTDPALMDVQMEPDAFIRCQELGWAVGACMWLFAYVIPVLAWYNSGMHWSAVLLVFATQTCFAWSFLIWLRVF
jgi:hypothetical protein